MCVEWGALHLLIASPRVDPRLDSRGGIMHIRNRCRGAVGDCRRKLGLIGPNRGSATPLLMPFWPIFGRRVPCGLLMLVSGCILRGMPVCFGLWALLVSEMQDRIFRAFLWCLLCVFLLSRTCVPTISNSPTLVKFVSNNSYHYCWCSIFKTLCRS